MTYERYGQMIAERGNVTLLENGYIDTINTDVSLDYYDKDEMKEEIESAYEAYEANKGNAAKNKGVEKEGFLKPSGTFELVVNDNLGLLAKAEAAKEASVSLAADKDNPAARGGHEEI